MYNLHMSTLLISQRANQQLKNMLQEEGHRLIEIKPTSFVYDAISSHPDIYACFLENQLIISPQQYQLIGEQLKSITADVSIGKTQLDKTYPANIPFNGVQVGSFFIHNLKHTDSKVLEIAKLHQLTHISVKQGYTKCNLVVVDQNSVITSDLGLSNALIHFGIKVLVIQKGFVSLSGFPYGFLGGASGRIGDSVFFSGNLSTHPDHTQIRSFIENRGVGVVDIPNMLLEDIGSIIEIPC